MIMRNLFSMWVRCFSVVLLAIFYLTSCDFSQIRLPSQLQPLDPNNPHDRLTELQQQVTEHRALLQEAVQAAASLASYNKLLAIEYINHRMYGLALESLEEAIFIEPENEILFYLAGLSSANLAQATLAHAEQQQLLNDAEQFYLRSIELYPDYADARYALSVLYIFELEAPRAALPQLGHLIEIERANARGYILLGRAHFSMGEFATALQYYQEAEALTQDEDERAQLIKIQNELQKEGAS